jgi:hypothetical protein
MTACFMSAIREQVHMCPFGYIETLWDLCGSACHKEVHSLITFCQNLFLDIGCELAGQKGISALVTICHVQIQSECMVTM